MHRLSVVVTVLTAELCQEYLQPFFLLIFFYLNAETAVSSSLPFKEATPFPFSRSASPAAIASFAAAPVIAEICKTEECRGGGIERKRRDTDVKQQLFADQLS